MFFLAGLAIFLFCVGFTIQPLLGGELMDFFNLPCLTIIILPLVGVLTATRSFKLFGAGFMAASYKFSEGNVPSNHFAVDLMTGFNIGNVVDISYTLRTGFRGVNHKIAAGYTYRFK